MSAKNGSARRSAGSSEVSKASAWAQALVGSIFAGFAVYQLGLKVASMAPAEILIGVTATYETVRDFLMLPLAWIHLDLTTIDRNIIVLGLVSLGAVLRSIARYPLALMVLIAAGAWIFGLLVLLSAAPGPVPTRAILLVSSLVLIAVSVIYPIFKLLDNDVDEAPAAQFVLLNLFFTVFWGGILLLLNWAAS